MPKKNFKVLITTSGLGQRLGDLTKFTNKSLVRIGKKPAISYIIEAYPKDTEFVITVGYFSEQVRDFINIIYPNRKITFVEVDKYQGPGSSLGYSMLQAKKYLQYPFIFHCNDTIVSEKIPEPDHNWNGGFKGGSSAIYSTFSLSKGKMDLINDKGALNFSFIHIGLVGIKDYKSFWYNLESLYLGILYKDPHDTSLNDCKVINLMIGQGKAFAIKEFETWLDIGNADGLSQAREQLSGNFYNLDKPGESIFIIDKYVVKFYFEKRLIEEKIKRAKILGDLVPKIDKSVGNFFRYKYVEGDLYSEVVTVPDFENFLGWCKERLWIKKSVLDKRQFRVICRNFYLKKTLERIKKFLDINKIAEQEEFVNGEKVPSVKDLINQIDIGWLSDGIQVQIHGDLILENIIKIKGDYKLLDWRQNFGGNLKVGDMYYDLSNLNHNLTINHSLVSKSHFSITKEGKKVNCDILRSSNLIECQKVLLNFIQKEGLDLKKIFIITALKWLSMSALHPTPVNFNLFLYYFGRLNLYRSLRD